MYTLMLKQKDNHNGGRSHELFMYLSVCHGFQWKSMWPVFLSGKEPCNSTKEAGFLSITHRRLFPSRTYVTRTAYFYMRINSVV